MYAPNMMALPRRRETRAQGQRAGRFVRPPSSRFFAKLSAAGRKSLLSWGKPRKRLPQVSNNCVIDLLLKHRCFPESWKLPTLRPLRAFCQDRIRPKYS
jgi:hypothetical protein